MKRRGEPPLKWIREERLLSLEEVKWLRSDEGRAVCTAMATDEPADTPAAIERWRGRLEPDRVAIAWTQVLLRRQAAVKFSRAEEMLFDRVALEQATSEQVAAYKAQRFAGSGRVADLCCGIGGDALALAGVSEVAAIDWSAARAAMASHNAEVYGHPIEVAPGDVTFDMPEADAAHVDPDRRTRGARRHDASEGSPGIDVLQRIVRRYGRAAIKLSPGADLDDLPLDGEIELISARGECKQAVVWTGTLQQSHRRATVLPSGASLFADTAEALIWPEPRPVAEGCVMWEPDPAVIRANLVGPLASRLEAAPIDENIAYLVGDRAVDTDLAVAFRVVDVMPFAAKRMRTWLRGHDIGRVEIKTRGFAVRPEELRRQLKLDGRGKATLMMTRVRGKPMAILAERIAKPQ